MADILFRFQYVKVYNSPLSFIKKITESNPFPYI